jgi:hypothetical protein
MNNQKLFYYNPTCEIAISNGNVSYMPNKTLAKFEKELTTFPLFFSKSNDYLLVKELPDQKFLNLLKDKGVQIPHFIILSTALENNKLENIELHPWGWSPQTHHIFKPLKEKCSSNFLDQPNAFWKKEHKDLYSRKMALHILQSFLKKNVVKYISTDKIAQICTSINEIEELILKWRQIVIKAPWSSSGRGLQVLRQSQLNDSIVQWINGTLKEQGYVMVEALLNKKYDFALQYYCNGKGKLEFLGPSFFETNSNGQYVGNCIGKIPTEIEAVLNNKLLLEISSGIQNEIENSSIGTNYCGYLGVDCMLFQEENQLQIQPCVEINLRYNMGTLAIFLQKHLHENAKGSFKIHFHPKSFFDDFHLEMEKKHPFVMENGKWKKGYLPLVSPFQKKNFGAYLLLE